MHDKLVNDITNSSYFKIQPNSIDIPIGNDVGIQNFGLEEFDGHIG